MRRAEVKTRDEKKPSLLGYIQVFRSSQASAKDSSFTVEAIIRTGIAGGYVRSTWVYWFGLACLFGSSFVMERKA